MREKALTPCRVKALTADLPRNLLVLKEAAAEIGITAERLRGLADGGYAPHYRIDVGPPLFRIGELRRWAAGNLLERIKGRNVPEPVRIIADAKRVSDYRKVPTALREVVGLCDITSDIVRTGIYFLCREACVLYIGQSTNAASRISAHSNRWEFDSVLFLPWPADDLDRIEAALIRALRPIFNGKNHRGTMHAPTINNPTVDAAAIASITNPPSQAVSASIDADTR